MRSTPHSKPYNSGQWTDARFRSFIKSALRQASVRWPPKIEVKRQARVERGVYRCAGYKRKGHDVPVTLPPKPGEKSRTNNVFVDHIDPIIDPTVGFVTWDEVIERMFVEVDKLQVLCLECHKHKTDDERLLAKNKRKGT